MGIEPGRTLLRFRWLANRHPYSKCTTGFWSLVAPNSGMPVSKEFLHIAICLCSLVHLSVPVHMLATMCHTMHRGFSITE